MNETLLQAHQYALVDPLLCAELPPGLELTPIVPLGLANEQHLLPLIGALGSLSEGDRATLVAAHEDSVAHAEPAPLPVLLSSRASLDAVKGHLASRLVVSLSGIGRCLLRAYDPKVFVHLQWMLPASHMASLMGPIDRWSVFSGDQWVQTNRPDAAPAWHFDTVTAARISRIEAINRVLDQCPSGSGDSAPLPPVVDGLLNRAGSRYGLRRLEDLVAFGIHGLTVHPRFDEHPVVARLITQSSDDPESSYSDASALLTKSDWQQIRNDLTMETSPSK